LEREFRLGAARDHSVKVMSEREAEGDKRIMSSYEKDAKNE